MFVQFSPVHQFNFQTNLNLKIHYTSFTFWPPRAIQLQHKNKLNMLTYSLQLTSYRHSGKFNFLPLF